VYPRTEVSVKLAAAGVAAGLVLAAGAAGAPPGGAPQLALLSVSPVPSNGALVFGALGGMIIETTGMSAFAIGPDGPVAGTTVLASGLVVWRPDAALGVGEYTVGLDCEAPYFCSGTGPLVVEVTQPAALEPIAATCSIELAAKMHGHRAGREIA
jgi:hypothetical protein